MVQVRYKNVKIFLLYIVAFFIIYESGTPSSIMSINDAFVDKLLFFFSVGMVAVLALLRKNNIKALVLWGIVFILFVILNSFVCLSTTPKLIYRLSIFLLIYLTLAYADISKIDFDEMICLVIVFFAVTSLIIYVLTHILSVSIPHNYFHLGENGIRYISYGGLYYEQGYSNWQFGFNMHRMTGPFWEPGVYQIFLNYALYRYIFKDKVNKCIIIILLLDLLLTMSAAGWLCTIGIIVLRISNSKRLTRRSKILLSVILFFVGALAATFVISSKFSETYANKSSAFIRGNDFFLAVELFIENPILGTGFNNTKPFELKNMYNSTAYLGSSNGFMTIAYTTGIIGLAFVFLPFIRCLKKSQKFDKYKSTFYICMILFFNFVEPVYYFPFMLYLLAKEYYLMISGVHVIRAKSRHL